MGIFGFFKKQFVDVIEWTESSNGVLAFRVPFEDREIQNGAQLTVRETQVALFVNEGEVADLFEPGRHTLTTANLPLLTNLKHWNKGFDSPFKSDVYFFSTREQLDQRWGTPSAIVVRDKELGPIRLRAHGTFSYRLKNPRTFFRRVSGTRDEFTAEELQGQLRATILTQLATFLGGSTVSFLDMAANQIQFSETLKEALAPALTEFGLELRTFYVQSVTLPDELQSQLDKVASMKMLGDLRQYAQFQAADSLGAAARNEGGAAGAGVGLGAGVVMGQTMAQSLGAGSTSGSQGGDDPVGMINKLHELMTKGVLTQAEFEAKKAELLKKIT